MAATDFNILQHLAEKILAVDCGARYLNLCGAKENLEDLTSLDLKLNDVIISTIRAELPDAVICSEEGPVTEIYDDDLIRFIIDPLDGTTNFVYSIGPYASSVGIWRGLRPVAGMVVDLVSRKSYISSALHSSGKVVPSSDSTTSLRLHFSGYPQQRMIQGEALIIPGGMIRNTKYRMIGCASMSLIFTSLIPQASYAEQGIRLFDIAGGLPYAIAAGKAFCIESFNSQNLTCDLRVW